MECLLKQRSGNWKAQSRMLYRTPPTLSRHKLRQAPVDLSCWGHDGLSTSWTQCAESGPKAAIPCNSACRTARSCHRGSWSNLPKQGSIRHLCAKHLWAAIQLGRWTHLPSRRTSMWNSFPKKSCHFFIKSTVNPHGGLQESAAQAVPVGIAIRVSAGRKLGPQPASQLTQKPFDSRS